MTDRGRRVLTRVGLRIPASAMDESGAVTAMGFDQVADIAIRAEASGFDSIWVTDTAGERIASSSAPPSASPPASAAPPASPASPSASPVPLPFEPYTVLGALATRTRTASLGAMVSPITARNPAVLAKIVTGLDVVSGGRAVLGVGMGGFTGTITGKLSATGQESSLQNPPNSPNPQAEPPDHSASDLQTDSRSDAERVDTFVEGLQVCRALFTEEAPAFEGQYYRIAEAHNRPRPIRAGGIPILVGGGEDDNVLRLAAQYADAVTVVGDVESVRDRLTALDRLCDEFGRDPAAISRIALRTLAISPTATEAAARWERVAEHADWDHGDRAAATVGSPEAVSDQIGELREAGVDGVVFTMVDVHNLELVELAGATLRSPLA